MTTFTSVSEVKQHHPMQTYRLGRRSRGATGLHWTRSAYWDFCRHDNTMPLFISHAHHLDNPASLTFRERFSSTTGLYNSHKNGHTYPLKICVCLAPDRCKVRCWLLKRGSTLLPKGMGAWADIWCFNNASGVWDTGAGGWKNEVAGGDNSS